MSSINSEYLWIIQAQYLYLDKFCLMAGLGRDSAMPLAFTELPTRFSDAKLVFPSDKCPFPEPWLKVLASFYLHNIPYQLFQATGQIDSYSSLTLLQPSVDEELQKLLGVVAKKKVEELKHYKELLAKAFKLLEK